MEIANSTVSFAMKCSTFIIIVATAKVILIDAATADDAILWLKWDPRTYFLRLVLKSPKVNHLRLLSDSSSVLYL